MRDDHGSRKWARRSVVVGPTDTRGLKPDPTQQPGSAVPPVAPAPAVAAPAVKPVQEPVGARVVRVAKGFYSGLPPRNVSYVDMTEEVVYDYATAMTGDVAVLRRTVPEGQIWLIDSFYFYGKRDFPFRRLIPDAGLSDEFVFTMKVSGSQPITYEYVIPEYVPGMPLERTKFPFLNNRLGPQEGHFGVWLLEGETISASYRHNAVFMAAGPPAIPVTTIGFRVQGVQFSKVDVEEILQEQT